MTVAILHAKPDPALSFCFFAQQAMGVHHIWVENGFQVDLHIESSAVLQQNLSSVESNYSCCLNLIFTPIEAPACLHEQMCLTKLKWGICRFELAQFFCALLF